VAALNALSAPAPRLGYVTNDPDHALLAHTLARCLPQAGHHDELVALLDHEDLVLSATAGYLLVRGGQAEAQVREAASRWPDDAPALVGEVRETLADLAELAAARQPRGRDISDAP
jgi:hypothetical protein